MYLQFVVTDRTDRTDFARVSRPCTDDELVVQTRVEYNCGIIRPVKIREKFHRIERICVCRGAPFHESGAIIDCLKTYLTFDAIRIISGMVVLEREGKQTVVEMGAIYRVSGREGTTNTRNYRIIDALAGRIEIDDLAFSCVLVPRSRTRTIFIFRAPFER